MIELLARWHWRLSTSRDYPGFLRLLDEVKRERRLSAEEWHDLNQRRLRRLLVYARDQIPYYGRVFAAHGFHPESSDLCDTLQRIPVLAKEVIRAHR
jgi:phenylacetate-CoA ligase